MSTAKEVQISDRLCKGFKIGGWNKCSAKRQRSKTHSVPTQFEGRMADINQSDLNC